MNIKTTIHKTYDDPENKLKALASVAIGDAYAVHGLTVRDGKNGLYVTMPSKKIKDDYTDVFHPITAEARQELVDSVMSAYEQKLGESQTDAPEETESFEQSM